MKFVLALVVFFTAQSTTLAEVQCGNIKYCNIGFKPFHSPALNEFKIIRKRAEELRHLTQNSIIGIHNDSKLISLVNFQMQICQDDTIGFLLDHNYKNYQISCIWTGSSQYGQCQPVPPKYADKAYYYISMEKWAERLQRVRKELGCSVSQISAPRPNSMNRTALKDPFRPFPLTDSELYICNERCLQAGIGYIASVAITMSLVVSFFKNCVEVQ